jgi:hypothetical protein
MAEPDHSNVRIRDIYRRAKEIGPGADREPCFGTICDANA